MKALAHKTQERLVGTAPLEQLHQSFPVNPVKEGDDICFQHPLCFTAVGGSIEGAERIMCAAARTETVRAGQEVLFIDSLQKLTQTVLYYLVLNGRYTYRTFLAALLVDEDPSDWLMPILHRLQPAMEVLDVLLQACAIGLLRDSINPYRGITAYPAICSTQRIFIHVMRQREQPPRIPPRCLCYPYESR